MAKSDMTLFDLEMVKLKTKKVVSNIEIVIETTAHKDVVVELHKQHLRISEDDR